MHLMEVSPFGLSKVRRGKEMDISGEEVRLPHVKKIGSSKQRPNGGREGGGGYSYVCAAHTPKPGTRESRELLKT